MILDSSLLVSFFRESDSNNLEATQLLKKHENESLVLPESILFETLTVLIYKDGVANAKATYEKLTSNKQVLVHYFSVDEKREIVLQLLAQTTKISFEDMSVIYLAHKTDSEVLAFDDKIIKLTTKK
ncbi:MAG: PIN domain-containing protein [Candidatus Micrarchaeota archaeon]|nr:PIN domain-containing protein [Candidatus Micrarchaeota archaeon]